MGDHKVGKRFFFVYLHSYRYIRLVPSLVTIHIFSIERWMSLIEGKEGIGNGGEGELYPILFYTHLGLMKLDSRFRFIQYPRRSGRGDRRWLKRDKSIF